MNNIKIMIADDNQEFVVLLSEFIKKQEDMEVMDVINTGEGAVPIMEQKKPDILILDMVMPQLDGLGVLEDMYEKGLTNQIKVIILTGIGQEEMKQKAMELGAAYYVLKPFNIEVLIKRIRQIHGSTSNKQPVMKEESLETKITKMIQGSGIPPHVKGYLYLKDAIDMAYHDAQSIGSITKILYPTIARKYNTTPSCVERAIRHSIKIAWDKKGEKKPRNGHYIASMAEQIKLEEK
jgi:two-component system response regulator (stage 0 sporulation protein A)